MVGFGSATFSQGTYGKGVMLAHCNIASTSTLQTFAVTQWESTYTLVYSSSTALTFGGLIQGSNSYMQGTGTMYSYSNPTWAGFGDIGTEQSTFSSFGHIAWDGQLVSDATWTTQTVS